MKKQATDQKKISVNHISNKGLLNRIYKELSELNTNEQCNYLNGPNV